MEFNRCSKCGLALIQEEVLTHECKSVLDYKFTENILWMFDGNIWYPRKLSQQPKSNTEKTTDDETEPNPTIVLYYAIRKFRYNGIRLCCFTSSQATKRS